MKKLLRKKESPSTPKVENEKELHECKIRVTAPQFGKEWGDVLLKDTTTAGEVVNRCEAEKHHNSQLGTESVSTTSKR